MRRADLLIGAGLTALLVGVAFTAPRWSRWLRQPVNTSADDFGTDVPPEPVATEAPAEVKRTINVKLFFEDAVTYHANLARQLRVVVEELLRGSTSGHVAPLAGGARVLEVFVTARGVAYVDVSKEITETPRPGTESEMMAVFSLVNSITVNFPAIKRVQILVEGRTADTLAGHIDLSHPLTPDLTLLAVARVPPAAATPAS
jgi:hypothetical protein